MTYTHPLPVIRTLIYASISLLLAAAASAQTDDSRGMKVRSAQEAGIGAYDPARFHALVIGINNYNQWPKLRTAVNDASAVADALVSYYGFPAAQVRRLLDEKATRRNILAELDRLADLGPDDSVLIYYAGHGWIDARNNGFWIPVDAPGDDKFAYVSNAQIVQEYFKKYQVRHLLVVSDSCFSGTLLRGRDARRETGWRIPAGFQKPSRWVMTSGDLAPVPDDAGTGHSPFATRLLQYLCYGDEPAFGIYDLFGFVKRTLEGGAICEPLDTPSHMPGGEFVLARLDKPITQPEQDTFPPHPTPASLPVSEITVPSVQAHLQNANSEISAGNLDDALLTLKKAVQQYPDSPDAVWALAVFYDKQLGLKGRADDLYATFLNIFPNDPRAILRMTAESVSEPAMPASSTGESFFRKGLEHYSRQEWDDAIVAYRQSLSLDPKSSSCAYNLGLACKAKDDLDAAVTAFRQALNLEPDMIKALYMLGLTEIHRHRQADALPHLNRLISLQPDFAKAHYLLGTVYQAENRPDTAAFHFERFLKLEPNDSAAPQVRRWMEQHQQR